MRHLFGAAFWLAARCSRRTAVRLSRALAWLLDVAGTDSAHVTRTNLRTCLGDLPEDQIRELARASLMHMCLLFFELAQLRDWPLERLLSNVSLNGADVLDEANAGARGILMLVPHYGNWELMCAFLGHHYSVAALYDRPKVAALEQVILEARQRYAGAMYPIDTGGMRSVYRELRSGGLVAILPDQTPDRDAGVYVPFFGRPALSMTLPGRLAAKTGCAVVLGVVRRDFSADAASYTYALSFERLEVPEGTDEVAFARTVNGAIEDVILRDPAQYQWEYKRFKRPPEGGPTNIYRRRPPSNPGQRLDLKGDRKADRKGSRTGES